MVNQELNTAVMDEIRALGRIDDSINWTIDYTSPQCRKLCRPSIDKTENDNGQVRLTIRVPTFYHGLDMSDAVLRTMVRMSICDEFYDIMEYQAKQGYGWAYSRLYYHAHPHEMKQPERIDSFVPEVKEVVAKVAERVAQRMRIRMPHEWTIDVMNTSPSDTRMYQVAYMNFKPYVLTLREWPLTLQGGYIALAAVVDDVILCYGAMGIPVRSDSDDEWMNEVWLRRIADRSSGISKAYAKQREVITPSKADLVSFSDITPKRIAGVVEDRLRILCGPCIP